MWCWGPSLKEKVPAITEPSGFDVEGLWVMIGSFFEPFFPVRSGKRAGVDAPEAYAWAGTVRVGPGKGAL